MVVVNPPPPDLALDLLTPYYASDELLSNARIIVFHGKANFNTNQDQAHVFSPAGLQSYPKLAVSPDAPAVEALPSVDQGDEICRALAVCLHKYFQELPSVVRSTWKLQVKDQAEMPAAPELFSAHHAAILAGRMVKVENGEEVLNDVIRSLAEQSLSWLDMDVVLPPGSLAGPQRHGRESIVSEDEDDDSANARYGIYAPLVKLFGEPAFLPTSKLKRAPSKPTGLNRSKQFLRQQKENLRREMCELLDTEENYVGKMYDLLHSVAEDFRAKARNKAPSSTSPSEEALKGLFPPSLDEILEANNGFLEAIRKTLEETENDAIQDIETASNAPYIVLRDEMAKSIDVTGTLAFANCMLEWFPQFADCYADYIQAHSQFGQYLRVFLKETGSSFSKRVQETGEQRLMSMLIEPVQRLPRYSLYIDNIIKQLPMRHPALKPLLKARDMISEICSRDSPANQQSTTVARLLQLVPSWPQSFRPRGRLVTAMDVIELPPPYRDDLEAKGASSGILLLFTDYLVLLLKSKNKTVSARGLTAEIDNPTIPDPSETNQTTFASQLIFLQYMKLSNVWFTEVGDGARIQMLHSGEAGQAAGTTHSVNATRVCMFHLAGAYEKKASRWLEETVKARVEGRFSEAEREDPKWEVRCSHGDLNIFSALFEANNGQQSERQGQSARVHVVIDPSKGTRVPDVGEDGIEIVASITPAGGDYYQIEVKGISGFLFRDRVVLADVLPALNKRVGNLLQLRSQIRNPALTATLRPTSRDDLGKTNVNIHWEDPCAKLNDALASYCLALHARKGNIVGRVIRNRASADETAVNELYNSLLEEPNNHELAAHASVDVLFSAFEKFVKVAWQNELGPVMPINILNKIQRQVESDSAYPGDFEEIVRKCTGELSVENQEALRASVRLLSDLLSGTSNDGDRGILTAAFAEILVSDGRPHDFIPLLDRFIEDQDTIFGRPTSSGSAAPSQDSMGSRYRGSNTGSLTSHHTSSLKKRFGFGSLRRENSKHESDEAGGKSSMWRTSNSTDTDQRLSPKRPTSRDRPTVLGAFPFEDSPSHSVRSFGGALGTIGEGHEVPKKKKRRSSLGDLRELQTNQAKDKTSTAWSPSTPRRIDHQRERTAGIFSTHSRTLPRPRTAHGPMKPPPPPSKDDEVTVTATMPRTLARTKRSDTISTPPTIFHTRTGSISNIPTLHRPTSSENSSSGPSLGAPFAPAPKTTRRLRLQSTQKLRERLQNEKRAIAEEEEKHKAVKAELDRIKAEQQQIAVSPSRASPSRPSPSRGYTEPQTPLRIQRLSTRRDSNLDSAHQSLQTQLDRSDARLGELHADHFRTQQLVDGSLTVTENRSREFERLLKEKEHEVEELYATANEELGRQIERLRGGEPVEELKRLLAEAKELLLVRERENNRLKRENVGLKSLLRDAEG
ncbi:hypothetical protein K490DRAFT_50424 [Saccharata proteae CBS 121410]|uniref:DH domain-containing protein n=1 Tax=Saccharata proteae CBS 121410 TaxID=1314787 RepID=A0A9P4HNS2_9PEZI|nr:hypothetical protein K490DRAFT_50424 [Saccharata proteae CBS 121410]